MQISLNGQNEEIAAGMTIADLLRSRQIDPATVVVEQNINIIDKNRYAETLINPNDTLEILKFVGGGERP